MPHFTHDGFKISYEERGSRGAPRDQPLVLIHGLLLSRRHHYPLADVLAQKGNEVILVDLLGHGESDRPQHSRYYTMELFAQQVVALLDHLDVSEAVIGGTSLGANVALEVVSHAPNKARALLMEMPVLERAAPAAGSLFLPLVIAYAEAAPFFHYAGSLARRLPRGGHVYTDVLLELFSRDPESSAAVLHGLLTGRLAPHPVDREKFDQEALIIGHERDILHPFSDASALHRELRNSQLVQANSFFQLRFPPNELSDRISDWLDHIWS